MSKRRRRIHASHRLDQVKMILTSPRSLEEIQERASRRSVQRWIRALEDLGIPIEEDVHDGVKRFQISRTEADARPYFGPADLISLEFGRIVSGDYRGLLFCEGLDDLGERLDDYASALAIDQRNRFRERILL